MPYKLTIELSDRDLRHFRRELRRTRESVEIADDEEILSAAADLVESMRRSDLPDFVAERLDRLETTIAHADRCRLETRRRRAQPDAVRARLPL